MRFVRQVSTTWFQSSDDHAQSKKKKQQQKGCVHTRTGCSHCGLRKSVTLCTSISPSSFQNLPNIPCTTQARHSTSAKKKDTGTYNALYKLGYPLPDRHWRNACACWHRTQQHVHCNQSPEKYSDNLRLISVSTPTIPNLVVNYPSHQLYHLRHDLVVRITITTSTLSHSTPFINSVFKCPRYHLMRACISAGPGAVIFV